jgi:hypothetical protein
MNLFENILKHSTPPPFKVELATDSPASSYGLPVLRCWVDGNQAGDFGPRDTLPNGALAGEYVAHPPFPLFAYGEAKAFCAQWPAGPQPAANEDMLP